MKRWTALLLTLAMLLCVCGCQNVSDAYSKKEEQALISSARELAADWLGKNEPAAVLGSEEQTYCDIVTDWHKYYLSGYVEVPYLLGEEPHRLLVNPEAVTIYSDENTSALNEIAAGWLTEKLGLAEGDVVSAEADVSCNLPVTYEKTAAVGSFPYSTLTGYLPVAAGNGLRQWLESPAGRGELQASCAIEITSDADLSALSGDRIDEIQRKYAIEFTWIDVADEALTVFAALQPEGGVEKRWYALGEVGPYRSDYLSVLTRDEPREDGGYDTKRYDYDLAECVRIVQQKEQQIFVIRAPEETFSCNLTADEHLPEMDLQWVWDWGDSYTWDLHWREREDGTWLLVNDIEDEARLWDGGHLTVSEPRAESGPEAESEA